MANGIPRHVWTEAEKALIRARYPDEDTKTLAAELGTTASRLHKIARTIGAKKSAEYLYQVAQRACVKSGAKTRFKSGLTPQNKGKKLRDYITDPQTLARIASTQFKDGHLPSTHVPIGAYAQDDQGLWKIKVSDRGSKAYGKANRSHWDWRYVHRLTYEAAYGPVPKNEPIIFIDSNPDNCLDPRNLAHVTRAELVRLNQTGFSQLPNDQALRRAAIAEAKARQAAHDLARKIGLDYATRKRLIGGPGRMQASTKRSGAATAHG